MEGPYFVAAVVPCLDDACPRAVEDPSDGASLPAVPCLGRGTHPGPGAAAVLRIPSCVAGVVSDRGAAYAVVVRQHSRGAAGRVTVAPGTVVRRWPCHWVAHGYRASFDRAEVAAAPIPDSQDIGYDL